MITISQIPNGLLMSWELFALSIHSLTKPSIRRKSKEKKNKEWSTTAIAFLTTFHAIRESSAKSNVELESSYRYKMHNNSKLNQALSLLIFPRAKSIQIKMRLLFKKCQNNRRSRSQINRCQSNRCQSNRMHLDMSHWIRYQRPRYPRREQNDQKTWYRNLESTSKSSNKLKNNLRISREYY